LDPRADTSESARTRAGKTDLPKSDLGIILSPNSYQSHIKSNYIEPQRILSIDDRRAIKEEKRH